MAADPGLVRCLEVLGDPGHEQHGAARAQLEAWEQQGGSALVVGLGRLWTCGRLDPSVRQLAAVIVKNLLSKGVELGGDEAAEVRGHVPFPESLFPRPSVARVRRASRLPP